MTRDEFNSYVARDHQRLMSMARFHAGPNGSAEDLLHTAIMRFCERAAWHKCPDEKTLRGYLRTTMRRVLIDQHRRAVQHPEHLTDSTETLEFWLSAQADPRGSGTGAELRQVLCPAVATLPGRWQAVVVHRLIGDRSIQQTAASLGIPPASVAPAMKRALARLAETVTV